MDREIGSGPAQEWVANAHNVCEQIFKMSHSFTKAHSKMTDNGCIKSLASKIEISADILLCPNENPLIPYFPCSKIPHPGGRLSNERAFRFTHELVKISSSSTVMKMSSCV